MKEGRPSPCLPVCPAPVAAFGFWAVGFRNFGCSVAVLFFSFPRCTSPNPSYYLLTHPYSYYSALFQPNPNGGSIDHAMTYHHRLKMAADYCDDALHNRNLQVTPTSWRQKMAQRLSTNAYIDGLVILTIMFQVRAHARARRSAQSERRRNAPHASGCVIDDHHILRTPSETTSMRTAMLFLP